MPKVTVEFTVEHHPEGNRVNGYLRLSSLKEFWSIVDMGFPEERGVKRGKPEGSVRVNALEDDPRVAEIFRLAARHGLVPCPRVGPAPENRATQFPVRRLREYSPEEIAGAELLRILRKTTRNEAEMGVLAYPSSAAYPPGLDREQSAKITMEGIGNDDDGWRLRGTQTVHKNRQWGRCSHLDAFLLGPTLKSDLEAAGLHGLSLQPVRYDHPEKTDRQLWMFGHGTKMPPGLLPRLDQGYAEIGDRNDVHGALWDEGGYYPEELRFRRVDVEKMEPFDVATTREKVGANHYWMQSEVIVTQRFRHTLAALQIRDVHYTPVRLVD
jgi:hypothetical protein